MFSPSDHAGESPCDQCLEWLKVELALAELATDVPFGGRESRLIDALRVAIESLEIIGRG